MAYNYNSSDPIAISLKQLTDREKYLLTESKTFCMYPWIHLHSYPTGDAYPCCHAEMPEKLGNCQQQSMKEIWSGDKMKQLRDDMLNERENPACTRCYEQEKSGFFSGRKSANKHHGHHIKKGIDLDPPFEMTYWDIRFSNLCNLSCRSCGHIFSSSWYQDQKSLAGEGWGKNNKPLFWAGRHETDMLEQLMEHIDCVEQIYFAGGEPLMMDEHYHILEELERREKFNVRLIYNTNFTKTKLKDRYVFDYWRKFRSVAVGASLDAMGPRAEYIRKGTDWSEVETNRQMMIEQCPNVDFYISPTMSIQNALHIPDFHRDWVERGYIQPQDLNVNILQDPKWLRIDIAPESYKEKLRVKFKEHLEWLRPLDKLNRATVGFESALNFLETDNSQYLPEFWERMTKLDELRNENLLEVIPELDEIRIDN
jgi:radical SAM protein with 4Fe4S-binding SPASM domain